MCEKNWSSALDQSVFVRNSSFYLVSVLILSLNSQSIKIWFVAKMELVYDCECTRVYGSDQSPMFYNFVENWVTPV